MTLIPVETPEDFLLAQQFLIPHEETCVSLASLVRRKSDKLVFISASEEPVVEWPRSGCIETTMCSLQVIQMFSRNCFEFGDCES